MELEAALRLQRLRAEQVAALGAALMATQAGAEATEAASLTTRYSELCRQLEDDAPFFTLPDANGWEVTRGVPVAQGAEPLTEVGLRFARMPGSGRDTPDAIVAQWYHTPGRGTSLAPTSDIFEILEYGEVFATEHVTAVEVEIAAGGEYFSHIPGEDPRPLEARMALIEQSIALFFEAQPEGDDTPAAG